MPTLEDPVNSEGYGENGIMHFPMMLLFWQGFLPEDQEHDLDYFIHQLHPRLAQFILRHPKIKQGISWYRNCHFWGIMIFTVINITIFHPFDIYHNWGNLETVIDNAYVMFVWTYTFIGNFGSFLQSDAFKNAMNQLNKFSRKFKLDNKKQKAMLHKTTVLCENTVKLLFIVTVIVFSVGIFTYSLVVCLPARKLIFSGWYPYDESLSPAYEITLIVNGILISANLTLANSLVVFSIYIFLYPVVYLKIIEKKFKNICSISIQEINKRKDLEKRPTTLGRNEGGLTKYFTGNTGVANQGHRFYDTACRVGNTIKKIRGGRTLTSNKELDEKMCALFAEYVRYQRDVISIIIVLSTRLNVLLYNIYLSNIVVYGGTLITLTMVEQFNAKEMLTIIVSFEIALFYLVVCIYVNKITDQCEAVGEAVYACDWFETSTTFKRSMLIVMTRAAVPVEWKAPGISSLSLKSFSEVVNHAYNMTTKLQSFIMKKRSKATSQSTYESWHLTGGQTGSEHVSL